MKILLAMTLLFLTNVSAFSKVKCDEELSVTPCEIEQNIAKSLFIEMMIKNKKGMSYIGNFGDNGLMLPHENDGKIVVSYMNDNEEETEFGNLYTSEIKYEITLLDCAGTDACGYEYKWVVLEKTESDGYTSSTSYVNTVKETIQ
jgi:hypothetical protein